jgi:hydroxymethylglutaryl-CoA reductase
MKKNKLISGFSKLTKDEKLKYVIEDFEDAAEAEKDFKNFWHPDPQIQKLFDEFSENTVSNFVFPLGVAPNFVIDGRNYTIPMVIEESSVVAAASNSAKFWAGNGGFHTRILSTTKVGHVHFIWTGSIDRLKSVFPQLRRKMEEGARSITANMIARGGGILDISLVDMTDKIANYYKIEALFDTVDSMGANFINSCLEEFAQILRQFILEQETFIPEEKDIRIIMSILSNYTPECLVKVWVTCDISKFDEIDPGMSAEEFVWKFEKAVRIAQVDPFRATTHNKGVFNGIDAVALATGNDFRAIEACGHAFASRKGVYTSLTDIEIINNTFTYSLTVPLALGTIGGLTALHPLAKRSLQLLGNPTAHELMSITASVGLANNFGAIKSLITKGIQKGHMKMHLLNILNQFQATETEKEAAVGYFIENKVSYNAVNQFLETYRTRQINHA